MMRLSLRRGMARLLTQTCPWVVPQLAVPISADSSVLLPAPLGPITAAICALSGLRAWLATIGLLQDGAACMNVLVPLQASQLAPGSEAGPDRAL